MIFRFKMVRFVLKHEYQKLIAVTKRFDYIIIALTFFYTVLCNELDDDRNNKTSNAHVFVTNLALEAIKLVYCRAINSTPVLIIFGRVGVLLWL